MKIILSRKGFDSSFGGYPSPVLPGGRMLSLPIPSKSALQYGNVRTGDGNLIDIMRKLLKDYKRNGARYELTSDAQCHLDPDLVPFSVNRNPNWKPMFGQDGIAQGHLENQGVKEGDLFLFFGLFRHTQELNGKLKYIGSPFHAIWDTFKLAEY